MPAARNGPLVKMGIQAGRLRAKIDRNLLVEVRRRSFGYIVKAGLGDLRGKRNHHLAKFKKKLGCDPQATPRFDIAHIDKPFFHSLLFYIGHR